MESRSLLPVQTASPPASPSDQRMQLDNISRPTRPSDSSFQSINESLETHQTAIRTVRERKKRRWLSKRFTNRLLLLTLVWQILNVGILTLVDKSLKNEDAIRHPAHSAGFVGGIAVMVFFQSVHLIIIVVASAKLTKQIMHHTASNSFLIQSYLSTVLLYAGVYTLLHRLDYKSFDGMEEHLEEVKQETYITLSFIKLLYFSVATMTGTGFGDIHSGKWYMDLVISTQMLLSVVYTTTIFARGISVLGSTMVPSMRKKSKSSQGSSLPTTTTTTDPSHSWLKRHESKAQALSGVRSRNGSFVIHRSQMPMSYGALSIFVDGAWISFEVARTGPWCIIAWWSWCLMTPAAIHVAQGFAIGPQQTFATIEALVQHHSAHLQAPLMIRLRA
eukprot:m.92745 g.92745  ORF g.92745 m.92745 type:complete len:389 (-) comp14961_c0_seq2:335-1501(-)